MLKEKPCEYDVNGNIYKYLKYIFFFAVSFLANENFHTNEYLIKVNFLHENTNEKLILNMQHDNKSKS